MCDVLDELSWTGYLSRKTFNPSLPGGWEGQKVRGGWCNTCYCMYPSQAVYKLLPPLLRTWNISFLLDVATTVQYYRHQLGGLISCAPCPYSPLFPPSDLPWYFRVMIWWLYMVTTCQWSMCLGQHLLYGQLSMEQCSVDVEKFAGLNVRGFNSTEVFTEMLSRFFGQKCLLLKRGTFTEKLWGVLENCENRQRLIEEGSCNVPSMGKDSLG